MKPFLRKLGNWLLGYLMFNAVCVMLVTGVESLVRVANGEAGVFLAPFTFCLWVPLRLLAAFDAIGFVKKVDAALKEAIGLGNEPEPEVWTELVIEEDEPEKQRANPA